MSIRFAKPEDKEQILNLLDELLTDDALKRGKKPDHTPVIKAGDQMFDSFLKDDKSKIYVAAEDEEVLGVAIFYQFPVLRRGNHRVQLEELVVAQDHRGKGIGTALVKAVINWCKARNITTLRINSQVANPDAHKFYEDLGGEFSEKSFRFDLK
jgi:GNAT superfamily N-acetyltransferase